MSLGTCKRHSRFPQTVVSPENLLADDTSRHGIHAQHMWSLGSSAQCQLDLRVARSLINCLAVQTGPHGYIQNVLLERKIATVREGTTKCLDRELATPAGLEGIGGRTHRIEVVSRPGLRPAQRLQAVVARTSLDLRDPALAAVIATERPRRAPVGLE